MSGANTRERAIVRHIPMLGNPAFKTDAIIVVRFGNSDVDTYSEEPTRKLLAQYHNKKKYKHSNHCHKQTETFFVVCPLIGFHDRKGFPCCSH